MSGLGCLVFTTAFQPAPVTAMVTSLKSAALADFTCTLEGFEHFRSFGQEFISFVRESSHNCFVVIDRAVGPGSDTMTPYVVRDHINLTGTSPLVGPNNPVGCR